jgi:hypothetical protein
MPTRAEGEGSGTGGRLVRFKIAQSDSTSGAPLTGHLKKRFNRSVWRGSVLLSLGPLFQYSAEAGDSDEIILKSADLFGEVGNAI